MTTLTGSQTPVRRVVPKFDLLLNQLKVLLEGLLARSVTVRKPLAKAPPAPVSVHGSYRGDDGKIRAFCVCDLPLAASAGAALGLFPLGSANEAIAARELPEALLENFREVLNVCSRLVNYVSDDHLVLQDVVVSEGGPDAARKAPAWESYEFEVSISGYGTGRLNLFIGVRKAC